MRRIILCFGLITALPAMAEPPINIAPKGEIIYLSQPFWCPDHSGTTLIDGVKRGVGCGYQVGWNPSWKIRFELALPQVFLIRTIKLYFQDKHVDSIVIWIKGADEWLRDEKRWQNRSTEDYLREYSWQGHLLADTIEFELKNGPYVTYLAEIEAWAAMDYDDDGVLDIDDDDPDNPPEEEKVQIPVINWKELKEK